MSDARWQALADADALGDALSDDDRAYLRAHADDDELALFADVERLGDEEPVRADDRARAEATLQKFRAAQSGPSRARFGVVALAVAAAAVLVWFVWPRGHELDARVSSGGFTLAGDALATGATIPGGEWVAAGEGACLELGEGRACFDAGSELRVLDGAIELRGGSMRVESGSVIVRDKDGASTLEAGDRRDTSEQLVARSSPPREPRNASAPASAPASASASAPASAPAPAPASAPVEPRRDDRKPKPPPSEPASKMLADARALANSGDLSRAAAAYDALRRAHPDSADAHAANVSLGQLQLRRGRAKEALSAFERYLKRGGALAEEARWGRVQALKRLARASALDRAIDDLLAHHPHTVYADDARSLRSTQ
ncbi:MAG TPA: tetratricopeptide repeat protein [Nannocystaceae bacterium]|nr:tetratricopeptide repeat protein [Nannocystaceae bacterium]